MYARFGFATGIVGIRISGLHSCLSKVERKVLTRRLKRGTEIGGVAKTSTIGSGERRPAGPSHDGGVHQGRSV